MIETEPAPLFYPSDHRRADGVGVRLLCSAVAITLFGVWIWFSTAIASLSLDYPLRRAGESAEFPALGTFAFYTNCLSELVGGVLITVWIWAIPMGLALTLAYRGFRITSWRWRIALACCVITLPTMLHGGYDIHHHMSWARENARRVTTAEHTIGHTRANKALVPTAGAALSAKLTATLTRHPVSTLTTAPAVGTA